MRAMMTVMGRDRPGIIASVTGLLFKSGANLEDLSMTILEGEFAMMLIASVKRSADVFKFKSAVENWQKKTGLALYWKDLGAHAGGRQKHGAGTETNMIHLVGRDQMGIVHAVSSLLARSHLNITDLNCKILGRKPDALYAMLVEVDVPRRFARSKLERALRALGRKLKLEIKMKPMERLEI